MDSNEFKCKNCKSTFSRKRYLTKHVKRLHPADQTHQNKEKTPYQIKNIECKEKSCNEQFRTLAELREHLESAHNLEDFSKCQKLSFHSKLEFSEWLADVEKKTNTKYVIACSDKKYADYTYTVFYCNRSGTFKSQAKLQAKQLKAQGSAKIGHHCTSCIIVKAFQFSTEVSFYEKHYKHGQDLQHIPISKEDKKIVAGKLLKGVAEHHIVQDFRNSDQGVLRRTLITKKDIYNIKKEFGISITSQGSVKENDEESVHAWIQEMEKSCDNPILLYKRQGAEHPFINKNEFIIVLMNSFQREMYKEYGGDRIYADAIHGISSWFELVTLLVMDQYNEGIPVAFCITSTVNKKHLIHFFNCIKDIHFASPNVFMSDSASMFYAAWREVFGDCPNPLLCSWHVERAWQGHMDGITGNKRNYVNQTLKSLLYEVSVSTFNVLLESFVTELQSDDDTKAFAKYFVDDYCSRAKMWAYCYRVDAGINTNMHIENFHRSLKYIFLEGKKTNRLDKTIAELNNLVQDKKKDELVKQYKGKITKKCTLNFKRHKEAENLNLSFMPNGDNEWKILSSENEEWYTIIKVHSCNDSCVISCRACVICPLAYRCSCHDCAKGNNICTHIHFINKSLNGDKNFVGPLNQLSEQVEEDIIVNESTSINCHEENKEKLFSLYTQIAAMPNMSDDKAKEIRAHLNAIDDLLNIPEPENEKIDKQKRFHSNEKLRTTKKPRLSKPSFIEREIIESILTCPELISTDENNDHTYC